MNLTAASQYLRRLLAASILLLPLTTSAQTITFGALGGENGALFSTYAEAGFSVELLAGGMCIGKAYGNPVPNLFGGSSCDNLFEPSTLRVKRTAGGLFRFLNTDLAHANGIATYTFAGYLATASLYSVTGALSVQNSMFSNFASGNATTDIDELRISLNLAGSSYAMSYNIDNIALSVSTVPEPATVALVGAGLLGLMGVARRRRI